MNTPQDAETHVRLINVLLAAGRPQAALRAFDEAAAILAGALDDDALTQRMLLPVARAAVAAGHLPLASRAAAAARETLSTDEARELDRLVEALVETLEYGEFVGASRLGTQWWQRPAMLADFDAEHRPLSRWLAARVDEVDASAGVTLHYADVLMPVDPETRPERAWTTMALDNLERLSLDELPELLLGTILEVGIYGDGEANGSFVVRLVDSEPIVLPESDLRLDRFVRRTA